MDVFDPRETIALANKCYYGLVRENKAALEVLGKIEDRFRMWMHNATTVYDAYDLSTDEEDMVRLKYNIAKATWFLDGPATQAELRDLEAEEYLALNSGPQDPGSA